MTYQYELQFHTDYIFDLLDAIRWMAHTNSTASHSEKLANGPAFRALFAQLHDLVMYSVESLSVDYILYISQSRQYSLDLYWGI